MPRHQKVGLCQEAYNNYNNRSSPSYYAWSVSLPPSLPRSFPPSSKGHQPQLNHVAPYLCTVSAVEQLQVMASKRQYKEAAAQLEVRMI